MIEKDIAIQIKEGSLNAVKELDAIVLEIRGRCTEEDFEIVKRGVGLSIGRISMELLDVIYKQYPELDDLA